MNGPAVALGDLEATGPPLAASTLWGLLLPAALVPLGSTTMAVALPAIGQELGREPAGLTQWLVNSYLLVCVILQSPAGKLVDRWGVHRALPAGQALFACGALLGFLGSSLTLLVGARVLMAAGGALLMPATMAVLRDATAPKRRARVFGTFGGSMGLAAALGPLLGGVLIDSLGWRAIFLANLPVLASGALLLRGLARTGRQQAPVAFDWIGSTMLALGLALAVTGSKSSGAAAAALLALGGAALFAFIRWEHRATDPVLDPELFRHGAFAAGASILALHNWVMYALIFQLPLWFGFGLDRGQAEIGQALLAMMLSMVVCSPLGGRAEECVGARATVILGTSAMLAGLLLLTRVGPVAAPEDVCLALVLIGAGLGLASAPVQASALGAVSRVQSGMAAGALSTMRYLGGIAGIGALGVILRDAVHADAALVLTAHRSTIWLYCVVTLVSMLPAALLPGHSQSGRRALATPVVRASGARASGTVAQDRPLAGRPGQ
jgi:MFS family permease